MACDSIEALQRSSESVFGYDVIAEVDRERKRSVAVYAFSGQSIEEAFEPSDEDIDYNAPRIPTTFRSLRGDSYKWELIPLLHDPSRVDSWRKTNPDVFWAYAHSKFFVWHPPRPDISYSIGIDTAGGDGNDSTVISVTELAPRAGMRDIQAAEFRSAFVSHVEAYAFAMAIASYYGQFSDSPVTYPLVGVEVVASAGDVCQLQMRKMGYSHFYTFVRLDSKRIDQSRSNKSGWYTYGWSRPILMGNFIHSVKNGWYQLNSPWTLYEMEHFETHRTATGKIREEHQDGEHDDGIFAGAISIQIARGLQSMTERSQKRYQGDPSTSTLPPIDLSPYAPSMPTSGHDKLQVSLDDLSML